jgi:aspartokinase
MNLPVVKMVACESKKVLLIAKMKSHGKYGATTQLLDRLSNMSISIEVTFQHSRELNCSSTIIKGISLLIYNETKCHTPIFSTK